MQLYANPYDTSARGLHETRRRRAVPPVSPTAPSHSAPPSSFTSPGRRTFTLGAVERSDRVGSETWTILYNGEEAGKLFRSANYGPNLPWHASTRELFWKYASDAPTGVGFDVAAFATAQQALDAWGRSADQILDWSEGKPVHTGYGHGPQQRATRESHRYPKLSPPPAHFVSPRARETRHRVADWIPDDRSIATAIESWNFGDPYSDGSISILKSAGLIEHVRGVEWVPTTTGKSRGLRGGGAVKESHHVADFNTLDDLLAHARGEGATHYLQIDDETHIYFQRRDGGYEKAEAWQKDGYWHTQAPGSRAVVRKPPPEAKPIGGRSRTVESPRRSAHHHPGRRK